MQYVEKPDDPCVVVTEGPAWQLLNQLDAFDEKVIRLRMRRTLNVKLRADFPDQQ